MRVLGHIGMFLAVGILMLHSFVPHRHHDEIGDTDHFIEHSAASSILDFINLAFHLDPSEEHLEEFEKVSVSYPFVLACYELEAILPFVAETGFSETGLQDFLADFYLHHFLYTVGFGAPPRLAYLESQLSNFFVLNLCSP